MVGLGGIAPLDHTAAIEELLDQIGLPSIEHKKFVGLFNTLCMQGDSRKSVKLANELLSKISWRWPEYDRRLSEMGLIRDDLAETMSEEEVDESEFADSFGMSVGDAFYSRVCAVTHANHRMTQLKEVSRARPYWRFRAVIDCAPRWKDETCEALDGLTARYDSEFWAGRSVLCWRPDCQSRIESLAERNLQSVTGDFRKGEPLTGSAK